MERPVSISIITVCRNSEKHIEQTIKSVLGQTYPKIQYLIIDGDSTDGTNKIIEKYRPRIDHFTSEPDEGMYDAINKGLRLATGDYILNLNSDDVLAEPDVIERVVAHILLERLDYYYGNIILDNGTHERKVKVFDATYKCLLYSNHGTFVPHPCFFISRELNRTLNGYNSSYKYASDYDYILRALNTKNGKGKHLDMYITRFRVHGESISASGKITPERIQILKANNYFSMPLLKRKLYYFFVWIYYKTVNFRNRYRAK